MKNYYELEGKVLSAWTSKTGSLAVKVAVLYEHKIGGEKIVLESVFMVIFSDKEQSKSIDVAQGDSVRVTGYLYLEQKLTTGGNAHQSLRLMGETLEVTEKAKWRDELY